MFYTFEGGEGAGKSTIIRRIAKRLSKEGYEVVVTREPGGGVLSEKIRSLILEGSSDGIDIKTEVLLFAASRREHVIKVIKPALAEGKIVLCDRFTDSSLVYQGLVREGCIEDISMVNHYATDGLEADKTFFLDLSPEVGLSRIEKNRREKNRFDEMALQFHEKVRLGYNVLVSYFPERIEKIDADQSIKKVEEAIWNKIKK
jgi:dTMP kinase